MIEAMALGLIVVSTNPGGIPFLLEADKEAKLVNVGDAAAMSKEIELFDRKSFDSPGNGQSCPSESRVF